MKPTCIKFLFTAILLLLPLTAMANMIWPSIYIVDGYYSWYVILSGLIIETIAARFFLKLTWLNAFLTMFGVNLISALLGLVLIPVSGIVVEVAMLPFGSPTFSIVNWVLDFTAVFVVNSIVEGLALKWIYKYPFKKNFRWLLAANAVSVLICFVSMLIKAQ